MSTWVFDVDGTVCWSGQEMTPEMVDALVEVEHDLVFLSGTDDGELRRMLKPLWDHRYIAILGNSGCTEPLIEKERVINAARAVVHQFRWGCFSGKDDQVLDRGTQVTISCIGRTAPTYMKEGFDPDGSKRKRMVAALEEALAPIAHYNYRIGGTTSIDITAYGHDKATGLVRFLDANKINPMDVVYFGDRFDEGGNDACLLGIVPCMKVLNPEHLLHVLRGR